MISGSLKMVVFAHERSGEKFSMVCGTEFKEFMDRLDLVDLTLFERRWI